MHDIIEAASRVETRAQALPEARVGVRVRFGAVADVPLVDALMKKHAKELGFLPTSALEVKATKRQMLVAETLSGAFAGYLLGNDRYNGRDEVGMIYQVCVLPEYRRMLVGAHLLKARFETSAYGCLLYGCWCAQDLVSSNTFYESMGFVPLAFRAGSEKKDRLHIYWQKRIREGDVTTPWWFPSETRGGLMDAARIALPIPPGLSWRDALPRVLPRESAGEQKAIGDAGEVKAPKQRIKKVKAVEVAPPVRRNGLMFDIPKVGEPVVEVKPAKEKKVKPMKVKKNDPEMVARARELRDRYMEQYNAQPMALPGGKYDVARVVDATVRIEMETGRQIAA